MQASGYEKAARNHGPMSQGQNLAVNDVGEYNDGSESPHGHFENYQAAVIGIAGTRLMVDKFLFRLQLLQVSKAPKISFARNCDWALALLPSSFGPLIEALNRSVCLEHVSH